MDISPKQMVGVSAGLIPFLEHDDANRALDGFEHAAPGGAAPGLRAADRRHGARAGGRNQLGHDRQGPGRRHVTYVDSTRIIIDHNQIYKLRKYVGLNERTCLNQKPVVQVGQKVKAGRNPGRRRRDLQG